MKNIQTITNNILYAYDPTEFVPIFVEGRLSNRAEFLGYKLTHALSDAFGTVQSREDEEWVDPPKRAYHRRKSSMANFKITYYA